MPHVFISYVRDNDVAVDELCKALRSQGVEVWLDREAITPGQRWRRAIRRAIQGGSYFIACFSTEYSRRDSTYMNEELTVAIDELRQKPTDRVWFIPVLLSDCEVPDRDIGGGENLRDLQWVPLFDDWAKGLERILDVVAPDRHHLPFEEHVSGYSDNQTPKKVQAAFIGGATTGAALNEISSRLRGQSREYGQSESGKEERDLRKTLVSKRQKYDVVILDFRGSLTIGLGDFELRSKLREVLSSGAKKVLLNLETVRIMDSSGLGELVGMKVAADAAGAIIKLLIVEGRVLELLKMARLIGAFEIFDSEAEALASFRD